jgi:two-component system, LytTR family, sensor kinase
MEPMRPLDRPAAPRARLAARTEVALIFGIWTLVGLLFASSSYLRAPLLGETIPARTAILSAAVDVYLWSLVTLAAFRAARRFPLERGRWRQSLLVHALFGAALVLGRATLIHLTSHATPWLPERSWIQTVSFFLAPNFVTYWMLVGVAHAIEYGRGIQERELRASQLESRLARAQLQMLKAQLRPHFLFNTLHAISTLVHHDPDAADRMIANLSELLRTTLAQEQAQEVTVAEEMALLVAYLQIEKVRLGERLDVCMHVEPGCREARLPHLLLQPLVENAIRHGIAPRRRGGAVEVAIRRAGDDLAIRVRDDGRGFPAQERGRSEGGVGLPNTQARLEQLYGAAHRFAIESGPDAGTAIEILIPFQAAGRPREPIPA